MRRQRKIQFARACMSRVVFGQFVLLVLLTLLSMEQYTTGSKICLKINFFLHCSIFSMPKIPNNLRERAFGMLDAGLSTEHVARHKISNDEAPTTCHFVIVRVLQRVVKTAISRTRICQTATATAANTPGLHNNRISAQTVRHRLRENDLHARRPYVGYVLTQSHRQNRLNWARVHTLDMATLEYRSFFG